MQTAIGSVKVNASKAILNANMLLVDAAIAGCIPSPSTTNAANKVLARNSANDAWVLVSAGNIASDVTGGSSLTHAGAIVKVSSSGVVTESCIKEVATNRVCVAGATDNGTDAVQVNGTVKATTLKGSLSWNFLTDIPLTLTDTYSAIKPTRIGFRKETVRHSAPEAGGNWGWVNVDGGTTWKAFAPIEL